MRRQAEIDGARGLIVLGEREREIRAVADAGRVRGAEGLVAVLDRGLVARDGVGVAGRAGQRLGEGVLADRAAQRILGRSATLPALMSAMSCVIFALSAAEILLSNLP